MAGDLDSLENVKIEETKPLTDEELKKRVGVRTINKDEQINLVEVDYSLKKVLIGVGWDAPGADLTGLDADFSIFLLDKDGMTREDTDFIFYNNLSAFENAVTHTGDDRTGLGDGDDERVFIDLEALPYSIMKISCVISIYESDIRDHSLMMLKNCFLRLTNQQTDIEILRYNIPDVFNNKFEGVATVAEFVREGPVWLFRAVCEPHEGGLGVLATKYGMMVTGA